MELYSLTKPQQAIWAMEQYFGGSIANITGSLMFDEAVDLHALQTALNKTIEQCDSLRIRLTIQDGTPMQTISAFAPREFEIVYFEAESEFESWVQVLAQTPFDLYGELYRFCIVEIGKRTGFVFHLHHLTVDAWTLGLITGAIMRNLKGEISLLHSYMDCHTAEREYETSSRYEKDKNWFLSRFEQCMEPAYLSDRQAKSIASERQNFAVSEADSARLQAFCTEYSISPYLLFIQTLATYIFRIKDATDMYIGTTILNRAGKAERETPGIFVNTIPVLFHVDEDKSVLENLYESAEIISGVFRHQKYQYMDILKDIRENYGFTDRLYDVMLNYQNAELVDSGVETGWHFCGCQGESLNIHINDRQHEGVFHLDYDYQTELFTSDEIKQLHEHLMNLLFGTIENPGKKPQELKLLSDDEYRKVVFDFNDTAVDFSKDKCVHQLFEEQVERTPDAIAVVFESMEYTYRQINEMASSLAHILRETGVGRNDIVAIIARRSYKVIIAQFAVLKAGGAYLPIDPSYPKERIEYILADANCKSALVLNSGIDLSSAIDLADENIFTGNRSLSANLNEAGDLCYCVYTSGSTGLPKGILITHTNVMNYIYDNPYGVVGKIITPEMNTIVSITTIGFDIYVTESLLALVNGLTVVFADDTETRDPKSFSKLIENHDVDIVQTTPSVMNMLLSDPSCTSFLTKLKKIILGGEVLDAQSVENIVKYTDAAAIYNIYGPTETTVWVSFAPVVSSSNITIGKPIANTQIYILDKRLKPLPIGAAGELCIAGANVAKGYLNRPELTAEKFVKNPFGEGALYRTGDLARRREDGNIEFIGRTDGQVKLRGMRVELGEIESAISGCADVRQVVLSVKTDTDGRQYLCAYYLGDEIDAKTVRASLTKKLPQYMIPHFFIRMESFPATTSGKTDRKALPTPDFAALQSDTEYAAPVTNEERALVELMQKVLNVRQIGLNDNFFDLGCDSLKAIEFVSKAHYEGIDFTLQDVFDHPTASELIHFMKEGGRYETTYQAEDFTAIHRLLEKNKIDETSFSANSRKQNKRGIYYASKSPLGDTLITGATGWLGVHILDEFLSSETGHAYCLVRGADLADSLSRLNAALEDYFGDKYKDCDRISVICGDITEKVIVDVPFDTIIHCAANVKHYGSWESSRDVNVKGTQNIIALAKEKGARLLHISTASVSGVGFEKAAAIPAAVFDETKLYIGQSLENVYLRSKFEAEAAVLQARLDGLDATVFRIGNLSNRRSDLRFQKNYSENATLTRLKAFVDLGLYLDQMEMFPLEFSPVDDTAKAVIKLAQHPNADYSVFHVYNPRFVPFGNFVRAARAKGLNLKPVPLNEFIEALYEAGKQPETEHIREAFIHDLDADGKLRLQSGVTLGSDFSIWYRNRIGYDWPGLGEDYLTRYIEYFRDIGYWGRDR